MTRSVNPAILAYANDDFKFAQWLQRVDNLVTERVGIGILDLADQTYRDHYDAGIDHRTMATVVMENEGLTDEDTDDDSDDAY